MSTIHVPVLLQETIEWLDPKLGQIHFDGTLGGGGHTRELAARVGEEGKVISTDRDADALERFRHDYPLKNVFLRHANFCNFPEVLEEHDLKAVDGILLDLGLSTDQMFDNERGFSYESTGELDLRFDQSLGDPAWKLLQRLSAKHIADLIYNYGEERFSRRIARKIVEAKHENPIRTSAQLAALVRRCVPRSKNHSIDPATRTFQALRIAVNGELESLESSLNRLSQHVLPNGRIAIISFHSLEDRLVKRAFLEDPELEVLTKKPIRPSEDEVARNPASRSSRLRVAKKIG